MVSKDEAYGFIFIVFLIVFCIFMIVRTIYYFATKKPAPPLNITMPRNNRPGYAHTQNRRRY